MFTQPTSVLTMWEYTRILLPTISKYARIHKVDVKIQSLQSHQSTDTTTYQQERLKLKRLHPVGERWNNCNSRTLLVGSQNGEGYDSILQS